MNTILSILEKCNESYSKGQVYCPLKDDEVNILETEFKISLPTIFVDDSIYDIYIIWQKKNGQMINFL